MNSILSQFGRGANVALQPTAHFGGAYEQFVASLNAKVKPAVPSQKVVLAIPPTKITAATPTVTLELQPLVDFKGEMLVLTQSGNTTTTTIGNCANFTLDDIRVGRDSQIVSATPLPGTSFSVKTTRRIGLNMKVCPTSQKIYIDVTNLSGADAYISGALFGTCGGCNEDACGVGTAGGEDYEPLVAIGVPITNVGKSGTAGATQTISFQPQVYFTGQQIVVPSQFWDSSLAKPALVNTSEFFTINSIKVGRFENLTSIDALPAAMFADDANVSVGLSMKACPTSLSITLEVTNLDAAEEHDFVATIYGFCGENGNCNTGLCTDYDIGPMAQPKNPAIMSPALSDPNRTALR